VTTSWVNAAFRSIVWLGATAWLAYLRKPEGQSVLAVRADAIGWLGDCLLVAGLALHVWSNVSLARSEAGGGATPAWLVVAGPYKYVRNPIYLAGITLLFGPCFLYPAWRSVDLLAPISALTIFHLWVVRSEEPALRRRFGDSYEDYCRHVPRWIPRLVHRTC
jgi:protein-S-isoprenylcysteine O-methyltransferase Ste14